MSTQIGDLIARHRNRQKWSQSQLAVKAGVSRPWVASVETGLIKKPPADKLRRIADVLGLNLRELLAITDQLGAEVTLPPPQTTADLTELVAALRAQTEAIQALVGRDAAAQRSMIAEVVHEAMLPLWEAVNALAPDTERGPRGADTPVEHRGQGR